MSPQSGGVPSHFLVIVPGYMGSTLRDKTTGEVVWIDFSSIPKNPLKWDDWLDHLITTMRYPNDNLEPAGLINEIMFVLPWAKQEQYSRLFAAFESMGYKVDPAQYNERERNVYAFPYDWRQDNRLSARELAAAVERWRGYHPGAEVWILAHSNGGLVARWYIEREGGKRHVTRLFLMGSPWDGTPVAMRVLTAGFDYLLRRGFNPLGLAERSRDIIRTFPSIYQLIPIQREFVHNVSGRTLNPYRDFSWLDTPKEKQLLLAGRRFADTLEDTLSVETLCFFGRKRPTTSSAVVRFRDGDKIDRFDWYANDAGDGTIPEFSAVHPNAAQKLPFAASHGDIYAVEPVLEFLRWELHDKYIPGRALVELPRLSVLFEPDRDVYGPGEAIDMVATVFGPEDDAGERDPIETASIQTELVWKSPLPGDDAVPERRVADRARLLPGGGAAGTYMGRLEAPAREGYYDLNAVVSVPGQPPVELGEILLIEAEPA